VRGSAETLERVTVLISLFLNLPTAQIVGLSLPQFFSVLSMALLFHQEKKREWKY